MSERRRHGRPHPAAHLAPPGETGADAPLTEDGDPRDGVSLELTALRGLGALVGEIGATLGLGAARLAQAEALDRLEATARRSVKQVAAFDPARVAAWFTALGDDLALDLRLGGLDAEAAPIQAELRAGQEPARALQRFAQAALDVAATQGDDVIVEARLAVGKARALAAARALVGQRFADGSGAGELAGLTHAAAFYSTAAWNRLLGLESLPFWERQGLARDHGRACVVLCDAPGYLGGLALDVVGAAGAAPPAWLPISRAAWRRFEERAREMRGLRADEGHWASAPEVLTPPHLRMEARARGLEETARRLAHLRAALSAAYLASFAAGTFAEGVTLRFAGPRPATCHLAEGAREKTTEASDGALARLCAWGYAYASPDKLTIARECLARELLAGAEVALGEVERAAGPALEAAKANFALYVRGKTERYFALRQSAQEAVAAYAETVRKAVGDLTGDVVDNVYRTVGLLVGVVVAALIQPAASLWVLRLAALLYTLYVAFILGFVLRARRDRYQLEGDGLRARLAAMPELTAAERESLRAPATAADAYFRRYFRGTRRIYLGLLAAGLLVFILLLTPLAPHLAGLLPASGHAGR